MANLLESDERKIGDQAYRMLEGIVRAAPRI
jgi:hypothetical protein